VAVFGIIIEAVGGPATKGMTMRALIFLVLFMAGAGSAQIVGPLPDYWLSYYWCEYPGAESVALYVIPDGSGATFYQARLPDGSQVDARIHVVLMDGMNNPIANYPYEDIWLDSPDADLALCSGGSTADGDTVSEGHTSWFNPVRAGGYSQDRTFVVVNGMALACCGGIDLHFNSPDLNGDLAVNLADVVTFAGDFYGIYHFRSDLSYDGVINLADVSRLAQAVGKSCP
jgi:hypothetical protein